MDADAPLPQIQLPDTFPSWLVASEGGTDESLYRATDMTVGHRRLRRMYTWAPVLRDVSLLLNEQQTREFELFYENDLLAGSRMFAARVKAMGPGHEWYAAQFREGESISYTPQIDWARNNDIYWRVDCKLVLYGTPREYGPPLSSFEGGARVPLVGRATHKGITLMSGGVQVPLAGAAASPWGMSGGVSVDLTGAVHEVDGLPIYGGVRAALGGVVYVTQPVTLSGGVVVELISGLPLSGGTRVELVGEVA